MGVDPPFLYDRPSSYSFSSPTEKVFNPKAVSQSSWTEPVSKPKPQGSLINAKELNRHPDSYFIVPYGQLDWKPLSRHTKKQVKWTRWTQLMLRVYALLGATGLLVCAICITGVDSTAGWIIRIFPGIAILHTVYAIYHLARSSKNRTPASSASYMIFAAIFDIGLIPFFVFTAMLSHEEYLEPSGVQGRWQTLFGNDLDTQKIIYCTFLLSVVDGGIHFFSLCISIYLAVIFRKIANLPPDMNPLEDNLTSRHKRNKSSVSTAATEISSRDSHLSAPLIDAPRLVPFMHTRTDCSTEHGPRSQNSSSNRTSRTDISLYQEPRSQRSSETDASRIAQRSPARTPLSADLRPASRPLSCTKPVVDENWIAYPSPSPSPSNEGPTELQHLRVQLNPRESVQQRVNKYTIGNRTPRPLEMNPPTPPIVSYDHRHERALAPMSGNVVWYEDNGQRPQIGHVDSYSMVSDKSRYYGNLYAGRGRVVSSGANVAKTGNMRAREVSGKQAEEGRAGHR